MTPEETKIHEPTLDVVIKLIERDNPVNVGYLIPRINSMRPKTEAERLALECPATDKVEVIAWMLEREKPAPPYYHKSTPEYVYGPEVPGTTTWPVGTEYDWTAFPYVTGSWDVGLWPDYSCETSKRRRIYRIGTQYQHDGSDVCPLADGNKPVEVAYVDGFTSRYEFAENASWELVTHFTPVKEV